MIFSREKNKLIDHGEWLPLCQGRGDYIHRLYLGAILDPAPSLYNLFGIGTKYNPDTLFFGAILGATTVGIIFDENGRRGTVVTLGPWFK